MRKLGRRALALLSGCALTAVVIVLLLREGPGEYGRVSGEGDASRSEARPSWEEAADTAAASGELRVSGPDFVEGLVPVAVVDGQEIVAVKHCAVNGTTDLWSEAPVGTFLVCAIDDLSRSDTISQLHAECVWPAPVRVGPEQRGREVVLHFRRAAPDAARIRLVSETLDGAPVPGVSLRVSAVSGLTTADLPVEFVTVGATGRVVSGALAPGRYRVSLQGLPDQARPLDDKPVDVDLSGAAIAEVRFLFQAVGSLEGRLVLEPPRRWSVSVYGRGLSATPFIRSLTTDDEGWFRLEGVPPGQYDLASWPKEHGEASASVEVRSGRTTRVTLVPEREPSTRVVGRIVNASGEPMKTGVLLVQALEPGVRPSGKTFVTNEDGELDARGLPPGRKLAILRTARDGPTRGYLRYFEVRHEVNPVDLGVFVKPPSNGRGVVVHGRVVDEDGVSLRGSLVHLRPVDQPDSWARFTSTDGGGRFRLDGVQPGRYLVVHEPIPATNYVVQPTTPEVVVGAEDVEIDLHLTRP